MIQSCPSDSTTTILRPKIQSCPSDSTTTILRPRIQSCPSDPTVTFKMWKVRFPIKITFPTTISWAQGRRLNALQHIQPCPSSRALISRQSCNNLSAPTAYTKWQIDNIHHCVGQNTLKFQISMSLLTKHLTDCTLQTINILLFARSKH
jgi:hypothetical protein